MVGMCTTARVLVFACFLTGCVADISIDIDRRGDRLVRRVRKRQNSGVAHTVLAHVRPEGVAQYPELAGIRDSEGNAPTQVMSPSGLAEVNGAGEVRFQAAPAAPEDTSTTSTEKAPAVEADACRIRAISTTWFVARKYFRVEADCITRVFSATPDKTKVVHCIQGNTPSCKTIKIRMWPDPGKSFNYEPNRITPPYYHGRAWFGSEVWQVGDTISKVPQKPETGFTVPYLKKMLKRLKKTWKKGTAESKPNPQKTTVHRGALTGKVESLWTFGSPVVSKHPLTNELSPDGCFPGRRVYGMSMRGGWDFAPLLMPLFTSKTTMMDVTVITADVQPKPAKPRKPANYSTALAGLIECYGIEDMKPSCSSDPAAARKEARSPLGRIAVDASRLHNFCYLFNYSDPELFKRQAISQAWSPGHWGCLLSRDGIREVSNVFVADPFRRGRKGDKDSVHLLQNVSSLRCFLTFRPLDTQEHLFDMLQHSNPRSWCGMHSLSTYIVGELEELVKSSRWKTQIQDKLPKCNGLEITGFSQGGSISAILAACLNKKSWDQQTYDALQWNFETPPQLLKPEPDARICEDVRE